MYLDIMNSQEGRWIHMWVKLKTCANMDTYTFMWIYVGRSVHMTLDG